MSTRFLWTLPLLAAVGCGKDAPPALPAAVEKAPVHAEQNPTTKVESERPVPKKFDEQSVRLVALDLRAFGLFAAIDVPEGTRVEAIDRALVFLAGAQGAKLVEGSVDLRETKNEWMKSGAFKVLSLPIDEPDALLAEVESGERKSYFARANVSINGKPYHWEEYFALNNMTLDKARQIVSWARTLRQTPALRKAQEANEAARVEFKRLGAIFPTPTTIMISLLSPVDDRIFEMLQAMPGLQGIAFINCAQIDPNGLASLDNLPKLDQLTLQGSNLNAAHMAAIANVSSLKSLAIDGPGLTDASVKPLGKLKKLTHLDLSRTRITDRGLVHLQTLDDLESLTLDGDDISGAGLLSLSPCKKLKQLGLADTAMTDASVKNLHELPGLSAVDLAETDLSETGLKELAKHPRLLTVNARATNITPAALAKVKESTPDVRLLKTGTVEVSVDQEPAPALVTAPIPIDQLPAADLEATVAKFGGTIMRDEDAEGKPIVSIDLHESEIRDVDLANVRGATKLQKLNLRSCTRITDAGLPYLAGLTALETLDLRQTSVKGDGLIHLQRMTQLHRLLLSPRQSLTGPQLQFLAPLTALEVLTFTVNEPAEPKLRIVASMAKLKELDLGGIVLSHHKLRHLQNLKNLESLTLGNKGALGDRALLTLRELVNLKKLSVPNYTGGDEGLELFRKLTNLESLEIDGPFITDRGISQLAACSKLESLRLDGLRITDNALAVLRNLGKLIALSLAYTPITDRGLGSLSENKELEVIDLSGTKVTDAGLAKLKDLEELRSLLLSGTAVTGSGLRALDGLPRLRGLVLANTGVNDAGLEAIGRLAPLQTLDLSRTQISPAGLMALRPLRLLEALVLSGCPQMNDDCVAVLKEFRALKRLDLRATKVSQEAALSLSKAGIQVEIDGK